MIAAVNLYNQTYIWLAVGFGHLCSHTHTSWRHWLSDHTNADYHNTELLLMGNFLHHVWGYSWVYKTQTTTTTVMTLPLGNYKPFLKVLKDALRARTLFSFIHSRVCQHCTGKLSSQTTWLSCDTSAENVFKRNYELLFVKKKSYNRREDSAKNDCCMRTEI